VTTSASQALDALQATVDELLDPPGCEWNRAQTHQSLVTYLVEETFELVEAIEDGSADDLREELGDVLYQIALHAGIAERSGEGFSLTDVIVEVDEKIRRRHPHVFGADTARDVDDIVRLWSAAKAREKAGRESAFDGVALGLPALARAQKIEARRRGSEPNGADAGSGPQGSGSPAFDAASEAEWGRALLAEVDAASARGWDAERALRAAVREREARLRAEEAARVRQR
jgi:XTP/dITP diphosphohydrolase